MKKILSILCLVGILVGLLAACQNTPENDPTTQNTTQSKPTSVSTTVSPNPTSTQPVTTTAPTASSTGPSSGPTTKPTSKPVISTTTVPSVPVTPTVPTTKPALSIPYQIPGTGLIIEELRSYDGIYVEDGTNSNISGVAMILLRNLGKNDVDLVEITLHYGELTRDFVATSLPKGMSVVVQEKNRKPVATGKLETCTANVINAIDDFKLSYGQIEITENADNTLVIKNLTGKDLPSVRLYYKYFMEEEQLLVGGVTFTANITDLKAGQSVTIKPAHYLTGASAVVMVQTYEVAS